MALIATVRHAYAAEACPQLEAELGRRLGTAVARSADCTTARLLLYVVLPVGPRLDESAAKERLALEQGTKVRTMVLVLRFGDTQHLRPATLSAELEPHSVQLAYTSKGLADLPMTLEGIGSLLATIGRKGD